MSRPRLTLIAFGLAIFLTALGWQQVMIHKMVPTIRLVLWFPFIIIFKGGGEIAAVCVSLLQFPFFALAFWFGIQKWTVRRVTLLLLLAYAITVGVAAWVSLKH